MPDRRFRWGILGTGVIAGKFATGLAALPDAELAAVGSRSLESAAAFAGKYGATRAHGSYQSLAQDETLDAIYVATPHTLHKENTLLCLEAGKAVLCEKPFAINALEAEEMIASARENGLFLMEAMWNRFLPLMAVLRQLLDENAIGEVRLVTADFGYRAGFNPESRTFDPALGGGALLDVGVYPISLSHMLFGPPSRIASMANLGETGVDEQAAVILGYESGQMVSLTTAIRTKTVHEAVLMGTAGHIKIESPWWVPSRMRLFTAQQGEQLIDVPFVGNGYNYEAAELMACVRAGKLESEGMRWEESLAVMRTMDRIRADWGLRYPMEENKS